MFKTSSSSFAVQVAIFATMGATIATSTPAWAVVVQPNGTVIPAAPGSLSGYLNGSANNDGLNEGIDVTQDASVEPQKFSPLCGFAGKYIAKGGGANFAVGWYNVDDNRPDSNPPKYIPTDLGGGLNTAAPGSDIYLLFPFSSSLPPPNQVNLDSVSIREHPAYLNGYIGFVLVPNPNGTGNGNATQYHYTEHRFNVFCSLCANPGPWYSDLLYKSKLLANTFYLGFEDLDFLNASGSNGINGNDLDYEDFLFRFTGVACAGAGKPCDVVGGQGICQKGVTDCDAQGALICKPVTNPGSQAEACDALDNDCNGAIDDNAVCPPMQICQQGTCVESCKSGEFPCQPGYVCTGDVCVEQSCLDVTCGAGEVCSNGQCRAACAGVVCPAGQICSADKCVDPCSGISCAMGQVCVSGICMADCSCRNCDTGQSCDTVSGQCVETTCLGMMCPVGTTCQGGTCVDQCTGVACPPGQQCTSGQCVPEPSMSNSSSSTGVFVGAGGSGGSGATGGMGGMGGMGGESSGGAGGRTSGNSSSCNCRVDSTTSSKHDAAWMAIIAALLLSRRRSRRSP